MIVMVNVCNSIQSAVIIIPEHEVDAFLFEFRNEVVLSGGCRHCFRYQSSCRLDVDFFLVALKFILDGCSACKLAKARGFQRCGYGSAVVIGDEVDQPMIFAAIDFAVG